jgi:hypothetical protein
MSRRVPFDGSVTRHSAFLYWLPRATVRQLPRYYQSAPTSRGPFRPALFRLLVPGSSATPLQTCPALRPRRTGYVRPLRRTRCCLRSVDGVGSTIGHISRLNHTACSLAVYASRLGLLRSNTAQDSLPNGGHSCWDRTLTCWVASGGFHSVLQLTSSPPHRSFPGAPTAVTPSRWRWSRQLGCRAKAGPLPRPVRTWGSHAMMRTRMRSESNRPRIYLI